MKDFAKLLNVNTFSLAFNYEIDNIVELVKLQDRQKRWWLVRRTENGIYLSTSQINEKFIFHNDGETMEIPSNGLYAFESDSFEIYYLLRKLITSNPTEHILDYIGIMIECMLERETLHF